MDELVLDTSYLLPIFGIKLEFRDFERAFPILLRRYSVVYNPASLVEAKWITLRLARSNASSRDAILQAYRLGLMGLEAEPGLRPSSLTDERVEDIADGLLLNERLGDYFDRIIYSTAVSRGCALLTEDRELQEIWTRSGEKRLKKIVTWSDVLQSLS
jgi:hypothetical protein